MEYTRKDESREALLFRLIDVSGMSIRKIIRCLSSAHQTNRDCLPHNQYHLNDDAWSNRRPKMISEIANLEVVISLGITICDIPISLANVIEPTNKSAGTQI